VNLNIRAKLFAVSLAVILVSTAAAELYLRPAIETNLIERIRDDLFARLALIQHAAGPLAAEQPSSVARSAAVSHASRPGSLLTR